MRAISAPTDLPGCFYWCKSDQAITLEGATQLVEQWNDLSGNGRHFTQSNSAKKPLLVQNALNGFPAIRGDGVDDFLQAGAATTLSSPCSYFFVFRNISDTGSGIIAGTTSYGNGYISNQNSGGIRGLLNAEPGLIPALSYGNHHILCVSATGGDTIVRADGTRRGIIVSAPFTGSPTEPWTLFAIQPSLNRFGNVEIVETFAFNRLLSAGEIEVLERYLQRRYALDKRVQSPLDVPSIFGWYRGDQVVLETPTGTNRVEQWTDLSGRGKHLVQASSPLKPTLTTAQGFPGLTATGNQSLRNTDPLAPPATIFAFLTAPGSFSANNTVYDALSSRYCLTINTSLLELTAANNLDAVTSPLANRRVLSSAVFNGQASSHRMNGARVALGNLTVGTSVGFCALNYTAGPFPMTGVLHEVVLYNRALSEAEQALVERYFTQYYQLREAA